MEVKKCLYYVVCWCTLYIPTISYINTSRSCSGSFLIFFSNILPNRSYLSSSSLSLALLVITLFIMLNSFFIWLPASWSSGGVQGRQTVGFDLEGVGFGCSGFVYCIRILCCTHCRMFCYIRSIIYRANFYTLTLFVNYKRLNKKKLCCYIFFLQIPSTKKEWLNIEKGFSGNFSHANRTMDRKHIVIQCPGS